MFNNFRSFCCSILETTFISDMNSFTYLLKAPVVFSFEHLDTLAAYLSPTFCIQDHIMSPWSLSGQRKTTQVSVQLDKLQGLNNGNNLVNSVWFLLF